jgi:hypothetical protein
MYTLEDFPIGSKFRLYKTVDIQSNPVTRKKGQKRFFKEFAYFEGTVTHHINACGGLVGISDQDSNEGYCVSNNRILDQFIGICFIVPERDYRARPKTGNKFMNHIIHTTKYVLKEARSRRIYYPHIFTQESRPHI